jgi:hypothetical protein
MDHKPWSSPFRPEVKPTYGLFIAWGDKKIFLSQSWAVT